MSRRVNAYQLSLLGDPPKPCFGWRRPFYVIHFFGGTKFPLMEDEIRQNAMLTPDTHSFPMPPALPYREGR